jgi:protein-L-isoaspartate O-methyltransferase
MSEALNLQRRVLEIGTGSAIRLRFGWVANRVFSIERVQSLFMCKVYPGL